jgi:hypothetical protein
MKNNQFEAYSSTSQIKTSIASLTNKVEKMKIEYQEQMTK